LPALFEDDLETTASEFMVPMNFTASAEAQNDFRAETQSTPSR
jgi:hypothetical protein